MKRTNTLRELLTYAHTLQIYPKVSANRYINTFYFSADFSTENLLTIYDKINQRKRSFLINKPYEAFLILQSREFHFFQDISPLDFNFERFELSRIRKQHSNSVFSASLPYSINYIKG